MCALVGDVACLARGGMRVIKEDVGRVAGQAHVKARACLGTGAKQVRERLVAEADRFKLRDRGDLDFEVGGEPYRIQAVEMGQAQGGANLRRQTICTRLESAAQWDRVSPSWSIG